MRVSKNDGTVSGSHSKDYSISKVYIGGHLIYGNSHIPEVQAHYLNMAV